MKYIVLGVIAQNGTNGSIAGQDTYLVSTRSGWFAWDGEHSNHAAVFPTPELALAAAETCRGPIFRLPDPTTIHVLKLRE